MPFPTNELSGSERKPIGINGNTVVTFHSKGLGHPVRYVVSYEIQKDVGLSRHVPPTQAEEKIYLSCSGPFDADVKTPAAIQGVHWLSALYGR